MLLVQHIIRVNIVQKPWFDTIILLAIFANCIFIGMEDPLRPETEPLAKVLNVADWFFLILFTVEMVLKWIALGFTGYFDREGNPKPKVNTGGGDNIFSTCCGGGDDEEMDMSLTQETKAEAPVEDDGDYTGYFYNSWNILDFVIVVGGWLSKVASGGPIQSIRILRVLRPLRSFSKIPALKNLVETLLQSLVKLVDVVILLFFLFIIYAIIGVQIFKGKLRQRCYRDRNIDHYNALTYNRSDTDPSAAVDFSYYLNDVDNTKVHSIDGCTLDPVAFPGLAANIKGFNKTTELGEIECLPYDENAPLTYTYDANKPYGFYNDFIKGDQGEDYIGCRNDDWCRGQPEWGTEFPYCIKNGQNPEYGLTSFDNIGASFLNVFIVVTMEGWVDIMYKLVDTTSPYVWPYFYSLIVLVAFFSLNLCLAIIEDVYSEQNASDDDENKQDSENGDADSPGDKKPAENEAKGPAPGRGAGADEFDGSNAVAVELAPIGGDKRSSEKEEQKASSEQGQPTAEWEKTKKENSGVVPASVDTSKKVDLDDPILSEPNDNGSPLPDGDLVPTTFHNQETNFRLKGSSEDEELNEMEAWYYTAMKGIELATIKENPYLDGKPAFVKKLNKIVTGNLFNNIVLTAIMGNTVILAAGPNMKGATKDAFEYVNFAFTWFFAVEMVAKLIGLGGWGYVADNWNKFDGVIVIFSLVEFGITVKNSGGDGEGGASGLSALRAFRLLRVFRVLGKFESLKILLGSVMAAMEDVAYLVIILTVFIFMFATLGISMFAKSWSEKLEGAEGVQSAADGFPLGRWTFGNIWWSSITVFQVLTGDAWNQVMQDGVYATNNLAIVYFLAVVIFGGFIVLTMFIAILLSRMGDEDEEKWDLEYSVQVAKELNNAREDYIIEYKIKFITDRLRRRKFRSKVSHESKRWKSARAKYALIGKSFGIWDKDSPIRKLVHTAVRNPYFEGTIDFLILVNCGFLAYENKEERRKHGDFFRACDWAFTTIFLIEMLLKFFALGVFPNAFWKKYTWTKNYDIEKTPDDAEKYQDKDIESLLNETNVSIWDEDPGQFANKKQAKKGRVSKVYESDHGHLLIEWWGDTKLRHLYKKRDDGSWGYVTSVLQSKLKERRTKWGRKHDITWLAWAKAKSVNHEFRDMVQDSGEPSDEELEQIIHSWNMTARNHNAYIASNWNCLDGFVVVVSIIGLLFPTVGVFRSLRAIRPLRIAVRVEQIKVVVASIMRAIPAMLNVILFCFLFWLVVGILGVNFFIDQFKSCECGETRFFYEEAVTIPGDGGSIADSDWVLTNKQSCLDIALQGPAINVTQLDGTEQEFEHSGDSLGCEWADANFNFNNIFSAIHSLFCLATLSGWNEIMYNAIDTNGVDMLPKMNNKPAIGIYFVLAVVICAFFSLNLIISVVVDAFARIKSEKDGSAFLTEEQNRFIQTQRLTLRIGLRAKHKEPTNAVRAFCYSIVCYPLFDAFIMLCIILNTVAMTLEYDGMSDAWASGLLVCDWVFAIIFTIEAILKVTAFGFPFYWRDHWNKFDFIIVIAGLISLADEGLGLSVFRVGRVVRLIQHAQTLQTLFLTLMFSIPSLWNIGLLIVVILFIYAVVGMEMFGEDTSLGNSDDQPLPNFNSFFPAIDTLFRVATGDGWTDLYDGYLAYYEYYGTLIYFLTFFVFGGAVLLNLFIAVILDTFADNTEEVEKEKFLKPVFMWRNTWEELHPDGATKISASELIETMRRSPEPAGFITADTWRTYQAKKRARRRQSRRGSPRRSKSSRSSKKGLFDAESQTIEDGLGQSLSEVEATSGATHIRVEPSDEEIINKLLDLRMVTQWSEERNDWEVAYRDTLFAMASMIVGPELECSVDQDSGQCLLVEWFVRKDNPEEAAERTEIMKEIQTKKAWEIERKRLARAKNTKHDAMRDNNVFPEGEPNTTEKKEERPME